MLGLETPAPDRKIGRTYLVWDSKDRPPDGEWVTVLWREFRDRQSATVHSLPLQVEEQASALRARFLAWLFELGESLIDGRRLVDHLELRPGFSFWWMTLLSAGRRFQRPK